MAAINRAITAATDIVLRPLSSVPPMAALAAVAVISAIGTLLVVRALSNAARIDRAKRGMQAGMLEMRLFNDDLLALLHAQADILRYTAAYLAASFLPMVVLVLPFGVVIAQLDGYFGVRGLTPGAPVIVRAIAQASVSAEAASASRLIAAADVQVDTPAVWFPARRELMWRLRPLREGQYVLRIVTAGVAAEKTLSVSPGLVRSAAAREIGALAAVENPSEPSLPGDGVWESIRVVYPARELSLWGWRAPWVVWYVAFTLIAAFILRRPLGVTL